MTAIRRWQVSLVAVGIVLLLIGGVTLLQQVPSGRYLGIGVWLFGALVVHDGIVAMAVLGASVLLRRIDSRIRSVILIVQGAVVVSVIVTALVLPEIVKKSEGTANPSILPLDYLANLGLFYAAVGAATAIAVGLCLVVRRGRRGSARTASSGR